MALSDGLVGYWSPWLGSSGYRVIDKSPRSYHATLTNMDSTDWVGACVQGKFGRALDFDGSNDYLITSSPVSGTYPLGSSARSLSCWFRQPSGVNQELMAYGGNGGAGQRFALWIAATDIGVEISGSQIVAPYTRTNDYRLLIATLDGTSNAVSSVRIFLDGSERTGVVTGSNVIDTRNTGMTFATISGAPNNNNFLGRIAEGAIWNRAITPTEILQLYRLGPGWYRPYSKRGYGYALAGFKAYWHRRQQQIIGGGLR